MMVWKCKMCGGDLSRADGAATCECEYCGSLNTLPVMDDEKKLALFARADRLRKAGEFDKAAGLYEGLAADCPTEAEAYWGLVLCRYGISYVDDPATGRKIPTCGRTLPGSVFDDDDFQQAQENADPVALGAYRAEAKAIDRIQKRILEISAKEARCDVFICYKETDGSGERTPDSVLAQEAWEALTGKGYRVFFARVSLEDKLGQEYEPYIYAALSSARIMLAFGTKYDYFSAPWVRNEWSRFLTMMRTDKTKTLIPCYRDVDAYDMPREFANLQGQDMAKLGWLQDLVRGVEKLLPIKKETPPAPAAMRQTADGRATVDSLLRRAWLFLEDGAWESAGEYFDKALDALPECAEAYLGKVCAAMKLRKADALGKLDHLNHLGSPDYRKAVRFADDALSRKLSGWEAESRARMEEKRQRKAEGKARREEQEARSRQERIDRLTPVRERIKAAQGLLVQDTSGDLFGIDATGTLRSCNVYRNTSARCGQCTGAVRFTAGKSTVLCADGKARKYVHRLEEGYKWEAAPIIAPVTQLAGRFGDVLGVRSDGTVAVACEQQTLAKTLQKAVSGWTGIVDLAADVGMVRTTAAGLRADGTVVAMSGGMTAFEPIREVAAWRDIVAVAVLYSGVIGLCADGTVVTTFRGYSDLSGWHDVVAITADFYHIMGLRADGRVLVTVNDKVKYDSSEKWRGRLRQSDVDEWRNVVAISLKENQYGRSMASALCSDGQVYSTGHKGPIAGMRLFRSLDTLQADREKGAQLASRLRALTEERAGLGMLAFKRKKELEEQIGQVRRELERLC